MLHRVKRVSLSAIGILLASLLLTVVANLATPIAYADSECQNFKETGYQVCGRFLAYWRNNGGLAQQGFPTSNVFIERNAPPPAGDGNLHPVQYFERARFEYHLENKAPYDILLGLLGSEQYKVKYAGGAPTSIPGTGTCRTFTETGKKVCGRFLEYWLANGGLAQQGLPVSDVFAEKNAPPPSGDGMVHNVQYFERARFEEHLENAKPNDVLLGLLGREQFQPKYGTNQPPKTTIVALGVRFADSIGNYQPDQPTDVYVIIDLIITNTTDQTLTTTVENFAVRTVESEKTGAYYLGRPLGTGGLPNKLSPGALKPNEFATGEIAFIVPRSEAVKSIIYVNGDKIAETPIY